MLNKFSETIILNISYYCADTKKRREAQLLLLVHVLRPFHVPTVVKRATLKTPRRYV